MAKGDEMENFELDPEVAEHMTDLERLTAMLSANAALRKHYRPIHCGGKEPSSFIILDNVETSDAVCFAFDKHGKLWNIHVQKPESIGSGSCFENRDGIPVLVSTSAIKQGEHQQR